jgi:hypothetical protein
MGGQVISLETIEREIDEIEARSDYAGDHVNP